MVRPPAVAIRDLLVFGGLGDLEKFCSPVWDPKVDFPGLLGRSGRNSRGLNLPHAECRASEPRLGSDVPLGLRMDVLEGAGSHFVTARRWGSRGGQRPLGWVLGLYVSVSGVLRGQWGLIGTAQHLRNKQGQVKGHRAGIL